MYVKLNVAHTFVRKWPIPHNQLFSDESACWDVGRVGQIL